MREFDLVAGQGYPRSSILVSIESAYSVCDFLLVISSNYGRIPMVKAGKIFGVTLRQSYTKFSTYSTFVEEKDL